MTLPDTLPDVPAEDWFQHQAQQFQQQAQAQIDSLHSGAAMDAIAAPLQAMPTIQPPQVQLPQIQGPPNPIDAIFGGGAPAAPAPAAPPPIAPAPAAAPPPAAPAPVAPPAAMAPAIRTT